MESIELNLVNKGLSTNSSATSHADISASTPALRLYYPVRLFLSTTRNLLFLC